VKSLFFRTFVAFMTALAVFILIVCIILFWGYNRSIAEWNREKQSGIEEYARTVIAAGSLEVFNILFPQIHPSLSMMLIATCFSPTAVTDEGGRQRATGRN